jgi:hypothetical protein
MKKVILMAALAAGVFSSCNNNELEGVQSNEAGKASINAVIEGSESRAGFESKTQWQDNDKLGLFMYKATGWGDAYPKFSSQNNEATKNAGANCEINTKDTKPTEKRVELEIQYL